MASFLTRTVGDVVSEILMSRTAFGGSFLVLEGDDDVRFWRTRAEVAKCQFVLAGSRPTVAKSVVQLEKLNQPGILGVVDDDYDQLLCVPSVSSHVLRTETRDLETLLLASEALDRVLTELADPAKVKALEMLEGRSIRDALVARSRIFGELRYLNALNAWMMDFDRLSPYRFADPQTWAVDTDAVLDMASQQIAGVTTHILRKQLQTVPPCQPWSLLHGKDTLSILAVGLRNVLGNQQHPIDRIAQMLRLAYDHEAFASSELCRAILAWEISNEPYRIVRKTA